MVALEAMSKDPCRRPDPPTPKMVDQYFNASTGEGDMGEADFLGPWNDSDSTERVDAPAFRISLIRSWALEPRTRLKPRTFRANVRRLVRPSKR